MSTILAAALLASCANAINTGPFGNGGGQGGICSPVGPGGVLSYGGQEFRNSGPDTGFIDKVTLYRPRELRLVAAYVVPITGRDLYGNWVGYPPAARAVKQPGVQWAQRQRADSARIPPAHGHGVTNLLLVLKPTGKVGTAQGIDVYYREAGQLYHLRTGFVLKVITARQCS